MPNLEEHVSLGTERGRGTGRCTQEFVRRGAQEFSFNLKCFIILGTGVKELVGKGVFVILLLLLVCLRYIKIKSFNATVKKKLILT